MGSGSAQPWQQEQQPAFGASTGRDKGLGAVCMSAATAAELATSLMYVNVVDWVIGTRQTEGLYKKQQYGSA